MTKLRPGGNSGVGDPQFGSSCVVFLCSFVVGLLFLELVWVGGMRPFESVTLGAELSGPYPQVTPSEMAVQVLSFF